MMSFEVALPPGHAPLPVKVWQAELLPADADGGEVSSTPRGNLGVGKFAELPSFLERPRGAP
jgi:hypothetical protein